MDSENNNVFNLSKEAIRLDTEGDYKGALKIYIKTLDNILSIYKSEKDPKVKDKYMVKLNEYLTRAEFLKSQLASSNTNNNDNKPNKSTNKTDSVDAEFDSSITILKPNVKWEDVAGLENAKDALMEAVLLPVKFPNLFTDKLKPFHCILLYGPPGTGKTYLAQALATEHNSTFIQVTSSDVMSKWLGDSEKFVKRVFEFARKRKPSVIFLDEIDAFCSKRVESESDCSRRVKTELLIQIQALSDENSSVLLLGSTNLPWSLDPALLRRFEKRIYIPLPDLDTRTSLLTHLLKDVKNNLTEKDIRDISERTHNFNCYDINVLVKETLVYTLKKCNGNLLTMNQNEIQLPTITLEDFNSMLVKFRPSVVETDLALYTNWTAKYGQQGSRV